MVTCVSYILICNIVFYWLSFIYRLHIVLSFFFLIQFLTKNFLAFKLEIFRKFNGLSILDFNNYHIALLWCLLLLVLLQMCHCHFSALCAVILRKTVYFSPFCSLYLRLILWIMRWLSIKISRKFQSTENYITPTQTQANGGVCVGCEDDPYIVYIILLLLLCACITFCSKIISNRHQI